MLLAATALISGFSAQYAPRCSNTRAVTIMQDADADAAHAALLAHLRAPIRQYDGGWGDTADRGGGKKKIETDGTHYGTGDGKRLEDSDKWTFDAKITAESKNADDEPKEADYSGVTQNLDGTFEGYNALGNKIVTDGNQGNFGRLSDKLKEADIERRLEEEAIFARENAALIAREARQRKISLMTDIPDAQKAGTVDDFMYKEGVQDILDKLDYDLIGLVPVKERVREVASLLVVDKMRLKLGLETSVPSLHMSFTGARSGT